MSKQLNVFFFYIFEASNVAPWPGLRLGALAVAPGAPPLHRGRGDLRGGQRGAAPRARPRDGAGGKTCGSINDEV